MSLKLRWKRDDGSGMETEDVTLWINDEPSSITISGGLDGDYAALYYGNKRVAVDDSRKELKERVVKEYYYLIEKEARTL